MPEMDGYTFYKELKKNPAVSNTPVMILTARHKMEGTFLTLGVDEFLVKPFATEALLEKVRVLSARGKASTLPLEVRDIHDTSSSSSTPHIGYYLIGGFVAIVLLACFFMFQIVRGISLSNASANHDIPEILAKE
jgi:DNA-binding NarL/FixJ family response regulator